jgi:DNA-binding response OmpR family regulator
MKKMVLIIDDDESLRNALADRIESMGFDHEAADSQHSATELLRKRRYDLILLDQELPVRRGKPTNKQVGRNLLEHIREDGLNQKSPVIIVTAHDGTDPMVACDLMNSGADYFLPKPRIDQLEVKIRETLARRKQKSQPPPPAPSVKESALKPFPGGRLEFQHDGIFLGEIRLASPGSNIGRILRELANLPASGKRRARSGQNLADSLGLPRGNHGNLGGDLPVPQAGCGTIEERRFRGGFRHRDCQRQGRLPAGPEHRGGPRVRGKRVPRSCRRALARGACGMVHRRGRSRPKAPQGAAYETLRAFPSPPGNGI